MGSPTIASFPGRAIFVELAIQVETFEDELDGRRHNRGTLIGTELSDSPAHFGNVADDLEVPFERHRLADFDGEAALESAKQGLKVDDAEVAIEDVQNGSLNQLVDDPILFRFANRFELDLTLGR